MGMLDERYESVGDYDPVLRSHCRLPEEKAIARGDGGVGGEKTEEDAEGVIADVAPGSGNRMTYGAPRQPRRKASRRIIPVSQ